MRRAAIAGFVVLGLVGTSMVALADGAYRSLSFTESWSDTARITANDNWSGVPGVTGFLGDSDPTGAVTNVDPRTLTADVAVAVDVNANRNDPNTFISGGVSEFDGPLGFDPVVALQGSGTADAPYVRLQINTQLWKNLVLSYNLRDIDGSADNAVQQFNAQYRVGTSGVWTNITGTYVADATTGPSLATLVTPISVSLPADVEKQKFVEIRIMTTNAAGNDEWVGIDDISITGTPNSSVPGTSPVALGLLGTVLAIGAYFGLRRRAMTA